MSLVSQILGLDDDTHINEVILGFLLSKVQLTLNPVQPVVLILMSI